MDALMNAVEVRVVGSLVEKQMVTPEYYPLTLNALVTACNQTSNRDPVVSYDGGTVTEALDHLRELKLIRVVYPSSGRVTKYRHVLDEALGLESEQGAVLTVLMLRGPQTLGELRIRTERIDVSAPSRAPHRGSLSAPAAVAARKTTALPSRTQADPPVAACLEWRPDW